MANYSRFHPKTFKFTIEDLLKIYVPSNDLGLFKTNGKLNIHLIDASGNQKNWKTLSPKNIEFFCYVVSLSEFDRKGVKLNKSQESINTFKECMSGLLKDQNVILIFTKLDLLKKKLKDGNKFEEFQNVFPDYKKDSKIENVLEYYQETYTKLFKKSSNGKIEVHFCDATSKEESKEMIDDILKDSNFK